MVDIDFEVLGKKYHLTNDERQYLLQEYRIAGERAKEPGSVSLSNPRYFSELRFVFRSIIQNYPRDTEDVITSLAELECARERVVAECTKIYDQFKANKFEEEFIL